MIKLLKKSITLIFCCVCFFQCKNKNAIVSNEKEKIKKASTDLIIEKNYVGKKEDKSYNITYGEIVDNQLMLEINYSGGCAEHEFQLISNGMWEKTYPPKMTLFLDHKTNEDKCREYISKKIYFTIDKTQYPGTNLVILKIQNLKNQIEYTY